MWPRLPLRRMSPVNRTKRGTSTVSQNRLSKISRQRTRTEVFARPDNGTPEDIEITTGPGGLGFSSRSRWPVPWAFALIVIATISHKGVLDSHLPWIVGAGLVLLLLWLGLFQLRIGRPDPTHPTNGSRPDR
jgi:hypothetical protein